MKIVIDMDEVLVQTVQPWVDVYNEEYDDNLELRNIDKWYIHEFVKPIIVNEEGYQVDGCGKGVYNILNRPAFFRDLKPIRGAVEGMKRLIDAGHDVVIATATPNDSDTAHSDKVKWVKDYLPFFDLNNFISIHRKEMLGGDIMFDDAPHNLEKFEGTKVCMTRPWNRDVECDFDIDSWKEFTNIVELLAEARKV